MFGRSILVLHNADSYSHAERQSSMNIEGIYESYKLHQPWPLNISSGTVGTIMLWKWSLNPYNVSAMLFINDVKEPFEPLYQLIPYANCVVYQSSCLTCCWWMISRRSLTVTLRWTRAPSLRPTRPAPRSTWPATPTPCPPWRISCPHSMVSITRLF